MKEQLRNRVQLAIIAVLAVAIAAMAYKFIVAGSVEPSADGRTAIVLEAGERDFVLAEMRGFVSGLQQITAALARDDMKAVAAAARRLGMGAAHSAPVALVGKLPLAFKTLAFSVHRDFDAIALDADSLGDAKHSLGQLADTLGKCAACHSDYRFKLTAER
ncbi:MAG TPA: hypothetical protein PKC97_04020 [Burkholderiaceae bacterium]|jgi:hypothetical protein|nr:hypothetical protein [Burkholderiaceae bacterium]